MLKLSLFFLRSRIRSPDYCFSSIYSSYYFSKCQRLFIILFPFKIAFLALIAGYNTSVDTLPPSISVNIKPWLVGASIKSVMHLLTG